MNAVLVMLGGSIGAMLRYAAGLYFMKKYPHPPIPVAMLIVNTVGSFGLGAFLGSYYNDFDAIYYDSSIYLLISIGFFGAFTTFSTFSVETIQLFIERKKKQAFLYVSLSILFSLFFFYIGFSLLNR